MITTRKYVAFMDILGYKQMAKECDHQKLSRVYGNLFYANVALAVANGRMPSKNGFIGDLNFATPRCNALMISDSVILWTENARPQSFIQLCVACSNMIAMGMYTGLPLRGGISIGDLESFSGNPNGPALAIQTVYGRGLISAYEQEALAEWAGCIIDQEAVRQYDEDTSAQLTDMPDALLSSDLVSMGFLTMYNVPCKNEKTIERMVLPWPHYNSPTVTNQTIESAFMAHNKHKSIHVAAEKLKNTISFADYVREKCPNITHSKSAL